jgi:hypothetical protein
VEAFPSDMASTWFEALHDAVEGRSDAATASHSSLRHHRGGAYKVIVAATATFTHS